jgi:hypothetical protein
MAELLQLKPFQKSSIFDEKCIFTRRSGYNILVICNNPEIKEKIKKSILDELKLFNAQGIICSSKFDTALLGEFVEKQKENVRKYRDVDNAGNVGYVGNAGNAYNLDTADNNITKPFGYVILDNLDDEIKSIQLDKNIKQILLNGRCYYICLIWFINNYVEHFTPQIRWNMDYIFINSNNLDNKNYSFHIRNKSAQCIYTDFGDMIPTFESFLITMRSMNEYNNWLKYDELIVIDNTITDKKNIFSYTLKKKE